MIFVLGTVFAHRLLGWLGQRSSADLSWARQLEEENRTGYSFSKALLVQGELTWLLIDTNSKVPGEQRAWLLWLDAEGRVLRDKVYGVSPGATGLALAPAPGGGVYLVGEREVSPQLFQGWVLRLDKEGEVLWDKTLGRPGLTGLETAKELTDGSVVVGGRQETRGWAARLKPDGSLLWVKELPEYRRVTALARLPGDALALACRTEISTTGPGRSAVLALRADGSPLWTTDLAEHGNIDLKVATQLAEGDVLVAGRQSRGGSGGETAWLARLGATSGQLIWQRALGEPDEDSDPADLRTLDGAGLVDQVRMLVGTVRSRGQYQRHHVVVALRTDGEVLWQQRWGGSETDFSAALAQLPSGELVVAGSVQGQGAGKTQAVRWQLSAEGRVREQQVFGLP